MMVRMRMATMTMEVVVVMVRTVTVTAVVRTAARTTVSGSDTACPGGVCSTLQTLMHSLFPTTLKSW